ncbi:hypothetical protein D3C77_499330 [compost metagenome]
MPEETADEGNDGPQAEGDDRLFGTVMQDIFEKITVPPDELARHRVEHQLGQVHVQGSQFQQDKRQGGDCRYSEGNPQIERARAGR